MLLRKTHVLKISIFSGRKFEGKKIQGIFAEMFILASSFSCLSSGKQRLRLLLICFARERKGFYQSSLANEVDFTDIMNVPPNIMAKN